MSRHILLPLLAASCVAGMIGWGLAQSSEVVRLPVVFTEREAVMVAPREFVAPPEVISGSWSPDGRYALVIRRVPRPVIVEEEPERVAWSLLVWDHRQRRAREVWRGEIARGHEPVQQIQWMAGAPVALLQMHAGMHQVAESAWEEVTVYARLHAASGTLKILGEPDQWKMLLVSPAKPFALLLAEEGYQVLQADGSLGTLIPYERLWGEMHDDRPRWVWLIGSWTADGSKLWVRRQRKTPDGAAEQTFCLVDPLRVTATVATEKPDLYTPQRLQHPLRVETVQSELQSEEGRAKVRSAWLVGKRGRVLVCADVQAADLSPAGDAVWYISQGAAWIAPLRKMSREQYEALYREKIRETVLSNAKQIGLALLMYVQDYDETFPPNTDIQSALMPYLKNEWVFNLPGTNFVYLMNLQTLASIDAPAQTMAGYIQTPYGRAVIWVDGHVTWESE